MSASEFLVGGARPLRFLIASTPRSGTGYIKRLLCDLGVPCTHERYFTCSSQRYLTESNHGESSWLAVPYLERLPPSTLVFHQVRNPVTTINSLKLTHPYQSEGRDMPFLREHFKPSSHDPEIEFWHEWHRRIEPFATLRYRVEEIPIREILSMIGEERSDEQIKIALAGVPRNFKTSGSVPQRIAWKDMPGHVQETYIRYGYHP